MKKIVALVSLCICLFMVNKTDGQNTTTEEYNWMVNGYKLMLTTGGEMKKGYYFSITDEFVDNWSGYKITYKVMKRDLDQSLVGILIILHADLKGDNFFCLPAMSTIDKKNYTFPETSKDFYSAIWQLDDTTKNLFIASLSRYLSMASTTLNIGQPK